MRSLAWSLILLSWTVAWTPYSTAQPTPIKPPSPARQRLAKGEAAPFDGTILNDAALATLVTTMEARLGLLQLEVDRLKQDLALEQRKAEAVCKARVEGEQKRYAACAADADRLRAAVEKAASPPWYMSPYLHFIMGSVVSGGVCAAATRIK